MRYLILLLMIGFANAGDNTINIDQVGDNNTINITQDGSGHTANVEIGKDLSSSGNTVNITQQDLGIKTATVEIKSGVDNGINILQQGTGNHTASILNLHGSGNSIDVNQSGAGNHSFGITNTSGTTNSGNTIGATQLGGSGADKSFALTLGGTTGANVTVQQTNPTQANSGSMSIQCTTCGNYSYIRY